MSKFEQMSIAELKEWLSVQQNVSQRALRELRQDGRVGVQRLLESWIRHQKAREAEAARMDLMWAHERHYAAEGYRVIAGLDEAGRGPLAGPVVAGAVVLGADVELPGLNDSKQLAAADRERLYGLIIEQAVAYGIGVVDVDYIDTYNILEATKEAMRRALGQLIVTPDLLLNDAVTVSGITIQQVPIIKGDSQSHSIAAASVLAKVTRDRLMTEYAKMFPDYGFDRHMGYSTAEHLKALEHFGPCKIHRQTFSPVSELLPQITS